VSRLKPTNYLEAILTVVPIVLRQSEKQYRSRFIEKIDSIRDERPAKMQLSEDIL